MHILVASDLLHTFLPGCGKSFREKIREEGVLLFGLEDMERVFSCAS